MPIELSPLPYDRAALAPHLSAETLDYHHGKHQRAYVERLNELIAGTEFSDLALEDIVRRAQGSLFNQAAQVWNHEFYWQCLRPRGGGEPTGRLAEKIAQGFGDFARFRAEHPDYDDAMKHFKTSLLGELEDEGFSGQELKREFESKLITLVDRALSNGRDPAQIVYNRAKKYGFASSEVDAATKKLHGASR